LFSHTVALRLLLLLLGAGLAIAAIVNDRQSIRILPPVWLAFALWAAWAGLSLTWSLEPERSLKEFRNEIGYAALAFWVCYVGAQARNAARVILPVVAAAAVLVCLVALYYYPQGLERYSEGWHGGPQNLSSALLTMMPCVLMAGWYGRRTGWTRLELLSLGFAALLLIGAYTTLNRTIWFGFVGQLLLLGALLALREPGSIGPRAKMIGAGLAILVVATGALMTSRIQAEREATGAATFAKDPRLTLWPEVLEHIKARPLTGYGFGRGLLRQSLRNESNQPLLWHAHNLFLDTVLQAGIPGLLLLLLLLGATLREGWRMARAPDDLSVACGLAVIGIVAGMVMRNMTDTLWVRQNALVYWGVLGVLFALGRRPAARAGP
jgi:O-antigen ligase